MTASIRLHSILIFPILSQYCLPGPDTDLFLVCSSRQAQMILYAIPQPNCKSFLPRFTRPSTCRAAGCSRPLEGVNSNLRKTHSTMRSSVIAYAMGSSPSLVREDSSMKLSLLYGVGAGTGFSNAFCALTSVDSVGFEQPKDAGITANTRINI